jgi:malonyl-CoA O-methyltransferase
LISGGGMAELARALPEKRWVGRSFSRAASGYDQVAALQRQVAGQLLTQLYAMPIMAETVVDVGAGTGYCTESLARSFPKANLIALDIAEGMLRTLSQREGLQGRAHRICGDAEALPLRDQSTDVLFSNLALQWCTDLMVVLREFKRILRPDGVVLFSTFGEATLSELRTAWAFADAYSHVNAFLSLDAIEQALSDAGFSDVRIEREHRVLSYRSVDALLRELKGLGAHNITQNRPRHLTGKGVFCKMLEAYAATGRIEASFETICVLAR